MSTLASIWSDSAQPVDAETERALVARVQSGDRDALIPLLRAYVPLLSACIRPYLGTLALDDARQVAIVGLLDAVHRHRPADTGARLGGMVSARVLAALDETGAGGGRVPTRTLRRMLAIYAAAGQDHQVAERIAPDYGMARRTYVALVQALSTADADLAADELSAVDDYAHVDDVHTARVALGSVSSVERDVCEIAYGFRDYGTPQVDAEVGHRLGLTRTTALRHRQRALVKMRTRLGVATSVNGCN